MAARRQAFRHAVEPRVIDGDLLDQDVEAIVNPWNRNLFPWWLLLPQGVSGAIKRRAGLAPFKELRAAGVLPLGGAFVTSAGRLPFRAIIHVAGIDHSWRASAFSIQTSVRSAVQAAAQHGFKSLALPLIGAGTGGVGAEESLRLTLEVLKTLSLVEEIRVVRYGRAA
jgi:O-acetyl-ADP-ribose deacetylase (regulator of RNase III)